MSKVVKQRNEGKKILKQKLVNYQNQLRNQSEIVIYDESITTKSEQFESFSCMKSTIQAIRTNNNHRRQNQCDMHLDLQTLEKDFNRPMKSLTRQNIQTINKKAKCLRSSLNEILKNRKLVQNFKKPVLYIQSSQILSPSNQQQSLPPSKKPQTQKNLWGLLTIRKSKKQQVERPFDYMRKSVSQQTARQKVYSQDLKPASHAKSRPKTSSNCQNRNEIQNPLTQYFTPCYHKETRSGYIINQFQPRLKAKNLQDNLKVMATIIKKKVYNLQGQQIIQYMKKISHHKNYYTPSSKVQQIVRKNNLMSVRNNLNTKLMRTRKSRNDLKELLKV